MQPGLIDGYLGTWIIFTNKVWSNQEWNHKWQLIPFPNIVDLSWCFPIFSSTQLQNLFLNDFITINIVLADIKEQQDKAYFPDEIFKKMTEKNPEIKNLRDQLDLEIDF